MRFLPASRKSVRSLFLAKIKLRPPKLNTLMALFSIIGLGGLCYLAGAAAMYFHLPTSEYIGNAFKGAETWFERSRALTTPSPTLAWDGVKNEVLFDEPAKTFDG